MFLYCMQHNYIQLDMQWHCHQIPIPPHPPTPTHTETHTYTQTHTLHTALYNMNNKYKIIITWNGALGYTDLYIK